MDSFTVTVADAHGGIGNQVVNITIGGTNDAPVAIDDVAGGQATLTFDGVDPSTFATYFGGRHFFADYQGYHFDGFDPQDAPSGVGGTMAAHAYDQFSNYAANNPGDVPDIGSADARIARSDGSEFALEGFAARGFYTASYPLTLVGFDHGAEVARETLHFTPGFQTFDFGAAWSQVDNVLLYMPHFETQDGAFYVVDEVLIDNLRLASGTSQNAAVDINVLANDRDPDTGDVLSVTGFQATSTLGASVQLNADGTLHYDPSSALRQLGAGETARDTFTYAASDSHG